jgi:hypothetical protein
VNVDRDGVSEPMISLAVFQPALWDEVASIHSTRTWRISYL